MGTRYRLLTIATGAITIWMLSEYVSLLAAVAVAAWLNCLPALAGIVLRDLEQAIDPAEKDPLNLPR
jgi:hypothetical protein